MEHEYHERLATTTVDYNHVQQQFQDLLHTHVQTAERLAIVQAKDTQVNVHVLISM
jgi:hypothetical protein